MRSIIHCKDVLAKKLAISFKKRLGFFAFLAIVFTVSAPISSAATKEPALTSDSLLRRYSELRFGAFFHFNMNTFSGVWGCDRQDPKKFNPSEFSARQWASACKAAKMKFGILTVKHHDGFVIWPSKMPAPNGKGAYTIAQSGKPNLDVVKEFVTAFRDSGLEPHLFYSVHDVANGINCQSTCDLPNVLPYVQGQIKELLTNYGDIPLFCTDGYGWYMGHGPKAIPYQALRDTIRGLQPNCLYFDHHSCTSPFEEDVVYYEEPKGGIYCPKDNIFASCQAITIMTGQTAYDGPMWFIGNPDRPCTTQPQGYVSVNVIKAHLDSLEPLWCNFIINCPPDTRGLLTDQTVSILKQIGTMWSPNLSRKPLPLQPNNIKWPISPKSASASSVDNNGNDRVGNGYATSYAIDGRTDADNNGKGESSKDQRLWKSTGALPQYVTMDLGSIYYNLDIFGSLPRQDLNEYAGRITDYSLQLSDDDKTYTEVAKGTWSGKDRKYHLVEFTPTHARYVRLVAKAAAVSGNSGASGGSYATISEIDVGGFHNRPSKNPVDVLPTAKNASSYNSSNQFRISGESFKIPIPFRGRNNTIEICDLSGKSLKALQTDNVILNLNKDLGLSSGVYLVKIKPTYRFK